MEPQACSQRRVRRRLLASMARLSMPPTEPLRPGESCSTDFVFEVPKDAQGLRLLITEDCSETHFVIGHENSLLHKEIYWGVDSAPSLTKNVQ